MDRDRLIRAAKAFVSNEELCSYLFNELESDLTATLLATSEKQVAEREECYRGIMALRILQDTLQNLAQESG